MLKIPNDDARRLGGLKRNAFRDRIDGIWELKQHDKRPPDHQVNKDWSKVAGPNRNDEYNNLFQNHSMFRAGTKTE